MSVVGGPGSALFHCGIQIAGGSQHQVVYQVWFDGLAWEQSEASALSERCEHEMAFHHSKVQAQADARPRAERYIGMAGEQLFPCWLEAFGIKPLWLRENVLAAV